MNLQLGLKSDPIEYRYSYDWLFDFLRKKEIGNVQIGSFIELYVLEDGFFKQLKAKAEDNGIRIRSCFTAHRELGGFMSGNPYLIKAALRNYKRYIEVAALLGADYVGGNPGSIYRDSLDQKADGISCYLEHMKQLMRYAYECGLKALTLEPMSSLAEPPSLPGEIDFMMQMLSEHHQANRETTVPVYLCGDVSHGLADRDREVVLNNMELFEHAVPYMAEFHFKNTDQCFDSTFGFGVEERTRGIVDLNEIKSIISRHQSEWPVEEVVGYLEIGGPKLGRDYSDRLLPRMLEESIDALKNVFDNGVT